MCRRIHASQLNLLRRLDRAALARHGPSDQLEAAIANFELACRMQTAVPELMDLAGETRATRALYGLDDPVTATYGQRWQVEVCHPYCLHCHTFDESFGHGLGRVRPAA